MNQIFRDSNLCPRGWFTNRLVSILVELEKLSWYLKRTSTSQVSGVSRGSFWCTNDAVSWTNSHNFRSNPNRDHVLRMDGLFQECRAPKSAVDVWIARWTVCWRFQECLLPGASLLALPWRMCESGDIISEEDTSRHALLALSVIVGVLRNAPLTLLRTCTRTRTQYHLLDLEIIIPRV